MEIVIRVDVLMYRIRRLGRLVQALLERLFALGVAGAGLISALYLCRCIFMWLAVA